jgi:hypothetical protein
MPLNYSAKATVGCFVRVSTSSALAKSDRGGWFDRGRTTQHVGEGCLLGGVPGWGAEVKSNPPIANPVNAAR